MTIGAIVQARMSSTRAPGKVLHPIAGKPLLAYLLENLRHCRSLDAIVVATSIDRSDDAIYRFCKGFGVECCRGSLDNVAERFRDAVEHYKFDTFVRVCGDSPLLDHRLIDKGIQIFKEGKYDIVTNSLECKHPTGQAVEIFNSETFKNNYPFIRSEEEKEHVTIYFYKNHMKFKIFNLPTEEDYTNVRLSVDYPRDLNIVSSIIESMKKPHWEYDLAETVRLYKKIIDR
ncbi:cytidylyltransferase domain-containing protein [Candidatus Omnitrophota bacterium]